MADTQAYREWLTGGNASVALIETMQISHPNWGNLNLANWDQNITVRIETGASLQFIASRFYFEPAEVTDTTGQSTVLTMSSLDGLIYSRLKSMTVEEKLEPIIATYRSYLRNDLQNQVVTPPPVWTIHSIEATLEAVRAEIRSEPLRIRRVGIYYTQREFPVLVYT